MSKVYHCWFGWVEETADFKRCGMCDKRQCHKNPPIDDEAHRETLIRANGAGFIQDVEPFISPSSGKIIRNKREMRDDMARTGCVPYDRIKTVKEAING
jgi:hypothetical protein